MAVFKWNLCLLHRGFASRQRRVRVARVVVGSAGEDLASGDDSILAAGCGSAHSTSLQRSRAAFNLQPSLDTVCSIHRSIYRSIHWSIGPFIGLFHTAPLMPDRVYKPPPRLVYLSDKRRLSRRTRMKETHVAPLASNANERDTRGASFVERERTSDTCTAYCTLPRGTCARPRRRPPTVVTFAAEAGDWICWDWETDGC